MLPGKHYDSDIIQVPEADDAPTEQEILDQIDDLPLEIERGRQEQE